MGSGDTDTFNTEISSLQIKVCNDDKIKDDLELTVLKQQIEHMDNVKSRSEPVETLRGARYNPISEKSILYPPRKSNNTNNGNIILRGYNIRKHIDNDMISPPYTDDNRKGSISDKPSILEHQLNTVRTKFERNRRMESQLGLTPNTGSALITPYHEAIDIEEQVIDRREEMGFRRRTFWKSCCGQIIDRRATQFFVQVFIGASVMIFCMAKIWQADPIHGCMGEDTTAYFSLLSALVGFYIPSPSMSN